MRERVRVLGERSRGRKHRLLHGQSTHNTQGFDTPANRYGLALALMRGGRAKEAHRAAAQTWPQPIRTSLVFQLALGDAELYAGAARCRAAALRTPGEKSSRTTARSRWPTRDALLCDNGQDRRAQQAQELLRPLLAHDDEDPQMYTAFGRACDWSATRSAPARRMRSPSYLNGRAEDALNQLKRPDQAQRPGLLPAHARRGADRTDDADRAGPAPAQDQARRPGQVRRRLRPEFPLCVFSGLLTRPSSRA